jgi:uncharacterized protein
MHYNLLYTVALLALACSAMAYRVDRGEYNKPLKLDNGFLKADAVFTRVGVFDYRNTDGSVRREARLPGDVFKADSLATLALVPITVEHPEGRVTSDNVRRYAAGTTGNDIRADGDHVCGTAMIFDASAVKDAESHKRQELSCGYDADLEHTPGEFRGERYDAIQRNIKYNHVALTVSGRAGSDVRLRLDSDAAEMVTPQDQGSMMKVKIDGVEFEVSDSAGQALEKHFAFVAKTDSALEDALKAAKADADKATARADSADAEVKKLQTLHADAVKPENVRKMVSERLCLERDARKVLGDKVEKLDSMGDDEIRKAVILAVDKDAKLDGRSADYIQGRFDMSVASHKDAVAAGSDAMTRAILANPAGQQDSDPEKCQKEFIKATDSAYMQPLEASGGTTGGLNWQSQPGGVGNLVGSAHI